MHQMFGLIEIVFSVLFVVCTVLILVDAFKDSLLKGFFCFLCWFYYAFYALFEFKHPNKFLIVVGSFLGGGVWGAVHFIHH